MHNTSLPCHGEQVNEALSYCVRSSTAKIVIVVYQNLFYQEPVTDNHIELTPHIEPVGDSKVYYYRAALEAPTQRKIRISFVLRQ